MSFPYLQTIIGFFAIGKFMTGGKLIIYRLASWWGSISLYKKGKKLEHRYMRWVALVFWMVSWLALVIYLSRR